VLKNDQFNMSKVNKNSSGIALLFIVVIIALIGLGVVGYLVIKPSLAPTSPAPTPPIVKNPTPTSKQVEEATDDSNETKVNSCTTDKDCSEGYVCDSGTICGGSPEICQEYGTRKCYKLCTSNSDCSPDLTCQQKSFPVNNDFFLKWTCFVISD